MADWFEDVVLVLAGGGVATASAVFLEWRSSRAKAAAVNAAIRIELREVAHRMVAAAYRFEGRAGNVDRRLLEWVRQQAQRYEGPNPTQGILTGTAGLLAKSDDEIKAIAQALAAENASPLFPPMEDARYTSTVVGSLHDLSSDYLQAVVDVLAHIKMFNESAEQSRHFLRLTFTPNLGQENHQKAVENVRQAEAQMAKRARIIVDKITAMELKATGK